MDHISFCQMQVNLARENLASWEGRNNLPGLDTYKYVVDARKDLRKAEERLREAQSWNGLIEAAKRRRVERVVRQAREAAERAEGLLP